MSVWWLEKVAKMEFATESTVGRVFGAPCEAYELGLFSDAKNYMLFEVVMEKSQLTIRR